MSELFASEAILSLRKAFRSTVGPERERDREKKKERRGGGDMRRYSVRETYFKERQSVRRQNICSTFVNGKPIHT